MECSAFQPTDFSRKRPAAGSLLSHDKNGNVKRQCGFEFQHWPSLETFHQENMTNISLEHPENEAMDCSSAGQPQTQILATASASCNTITSTSVIPHQQFPRVQKQTVQCPRCCAGEPGHIRHIMS
ncbi:uncharacterized protein LOC116601532 [Nematostella vectensis]|uniref:uncharacterized protein LOC116601532 n=1 Tax=Nematostella vectensis TaxID=45351 RepID=UPI0013901374|nr:uncharacterized protein LOC116601532 [Nematostella vectensis]